MASLQDSFDVDWSTAGSEEARSFFAEDAHKLLAHLESNLERGLTESTASRRLAEDGKNLLRPTGMLPLARRFFVAFVGGFQLLLWLSIALTWMAYNFSITQSRKQYSLTIAFMLLFVCTLSGAIQFTQEAKESRALFLKNMPVKECNVIRDGVRKTIQSSHLVVGDIVEMSSGDAVPTDMRVVSAEGVTVDKSWLTGESRSQRVTADPLPESTPYIEAINMVFAGSRVVDGTCRGVAVTTGRHNQLTKIVGFARGQHKIPTFEQDIHMFVRVLTVTVATCIIMISVFWITYTSKEHPLYLSLDLLLLKLVGVVVAIMPIGLRFVKNIGLTGSARHLISTYGVLGKKLDTVVTLGKITLLVADKTGTITQNSLFVVDVVSATGLRRSTAEWSGDPADTTELSPAVLAATHRIAALCNDAILDIGDPKRCSDVDAPAESVHQVAFGGNTTDRCLLGWANSSEQRKVSEVLEANEVLKRQRFMSSARRAMVVIRDKETEEAYVLVKGAPDDILPHCTHWWNDDGDSEEWKENDKDKVRDAITQQAASGCRMLLTAQIGPLSNEQVQQYTKATQFPETGLTFVSSVAMNDPPREGARAAVEQMRAAGIRVVMVTGDAPATAIFAAKATGIFSDPEKPVHTIEDMHHHLGDGNKTVLGRGAIVVVGDEISRISEREWEYVFSHGEVVFARTTAEQRVLLVERGQRMGHLVAVTGDGVNDTPALKRATVGIAMVTSPDITREISDIVLLTDDFAAIGSAVARGRLLFTNMRCVLAYFLTSSCAKTVSVLAQFFLGVPTPLAVFPMILIGCLHDVLGGVALMMETQDGALMTTAPRDALQKRLMDRSVLVYSYLFYGLMLSFGAFYNYCDYMHSQGFSARDLVFAWAWTHPTRPQQSEADEGVMRAASSVFYLTLVLSQAAHLLSVRRRRPYFCEYFMPRGGTNGRKSSDRNSAKGLSAIPSWTALIVVALTVACTVPFLHIPVIGDYCYTAPVSTRHWGVAVGWSALWFAVAEARKWIILLYPHSWLARMDWW